MTSTVIAFHSGYGHTRRFAQALADGAAGTRGDEARLLDVATIDDDAWAALAVADAIVFGAPTYMGGASAQFKAFADASSKVWISQGWKDKVAGGFTCSLNLTGDKDSTLSWLVTFAMQHGMVWAGLGILPASDPGDPQAINRLGAYTGLLAQADNVPPDQSPPPGDLDTAAAYGRRIAALARRLRSNAGN